MIQIARSSKEGKPVTLNTIAAKTSVSRRYLEQVVIPLKHANLLRGRRGKNGGYLLAKPPDEIMIGDIIQAAIGPINIVDCVNNPDSCMQTDFCECRLLYAMINSRIIDAMNDFSLADLAGERGQEPISREQEGPSRDRNA
jgi:Rrf2 family protein